MEEFLLPAEAQAVLESTGGWKAQSELEYVGQNKAVGEIGGLAFCQSRCQKVSQYIYFDSILNIFILFYFVLFYLFV